MRVGLFVTCLVDLVRPRIGFATLNLLEAAGCDVVVPATQTCCGQPAWNSGDRPAARALAEKAIAEFEQFDWVVVPSGSCAGMIATHYRHLFEGEGAWLARCEALAAKTRELTDFLVNVARIQRVSGTFPGTITYHDSCSGLRELGVKNQPRTLLAKLPGATLREMKDCETCCGFGGTFSVKFGEISAAMADAKCDNVRASGADAVVLGDLGCMLNIEGRLSRRGENTRVLHIAEALTAASPGPATLPEP
jgi:L-lactate dehydrogenase complex protein LldE